MLGQRQDPKLLSAAIQRIEDLQHAQLAAIQTLARKLDELEAGNRMERQFGAGGSRLPPATSAAIRVAATGAGIDEHIAQCGLRATEAELLRELYGGNCDAGRLTTGNTVKQTDGRPINTGSTGG